MKLATFVMAVSAFFFSFQSAWADAFVWNNGTFTIFNAPGANPGSTAAEGINSSGQIVGWFDDHTGRHGFLDTNGTFTTIDFPGSAFTEALGINNAGQIVGLFTASGGLPQAFLDNNGAFSLIDGPSSGANGINSTDQIVGSMGQVNETAFVYANGIVTPITLPFSDVLFSEGHGINDSSQVVGVYFTNSGAHGFLDSNGAFSSINVPGATNTYSYGINNSGQIVGAYSEQVGSQQISRGYLYTNGLFTTIDVSGDTNTVANGINAAGQVVGSFTAIPEPASVVLLVSGFIFLGFWIRRRSIV